MGKYTLSKKKLILQELCSKHINLMEPHRKLMAIYKDLNVLNFEQKERKEWFVGLFTDCLVVFASSRYDWTSVLKFRFVQADTYYFHIMFNELSYAVDIADLYTWKNMIAVRFILFIIYRFLAVKIS